MGNLKGITRNELNSLCLLAQGDDVAEEVRKDYLARLTGRAARIGRILMNCKPDHSDPPSEEDFAAVRDLGDWAAAMDAN